MPSVKTECTELSVGFGILARDNLLELDESQIENIFEGTLSIEKYRRFQAEFQNNTTLYRQMYNVGFALRAVYQPFRNVSSLKWEGPNRQAATTAAARDLVVANLPVSVKENSDVVHNPSPYNLFNTIPAGQVPAQTSENWYLIHAPQEYQELYNFVQSRGLEHLPEDVYEFEESIKGSEREPIKTAINQFSNEEKLAFKQLYLNMCHRVASVSADIFNQIFSNSMQGRSKSAVLEHVVKHFFRMSSVEYILGGIDKKKAFAVIIPEVSQWKRDWTITNIIAEPELNREQSRVRFSVFYKNNSLPDTF